MQATTDALELLTRPSNPAAVAARVEACQPSATLRVGVLVNPRAGRARSEHLRRRLQQLAGSDAAYAETRDLDSLGRALAQLLCTHGANVLAIVGGDGTIHHTVNALLRWTAACARTQACDVPLPRLLLLNGGTLNIVGRTCAIHGPSDTILQRFLRDFGGLPLSHVPVRDLPLLQVQWLDQPDEAVRFGFVFGSEAAYHAIELYERFGSGYGGLTRFLFELARGVWGGSALWQREGWKLGPYRTPLRVDGRQWDVYTGAAAATVDLTLAIGAVRAIRRQLDQPGFSVRVVEETQPSRLVRMVPALMSERAAAGLCDLPTATEMTLAGPYTLDGELIHQRGDTAQRRPLRVTRSAVSLLAVPGQWPRMRR
jgi:hypothetical protein